MVVGDSKEEVMIFRDKLTGGSNRPFRCLDIALMVGDVVIIEKVSHQI